MFDYQRMYHQGVRVPDIEVAMAEMGGALGVSWARLQERQQPIWTPGRGVEVVPLRFTYSCEGPQHIELLQGTPGTFWDGTQQPGAHHVGVWVDDVVAETEALVDPVHPPEEGYGMYTYLAPPSGLIVELVHSAALPMFERWWAGGDLA
jgi:Glyoxalase/Bleomycin resistance protein/Dioxygenase superfamily